MSIDTTQSNPYNDYLNTKNNINTLRGTKRSSLVLQTPSQSSLLADKKIPNATSSPPKHHGSQPHIPASQPTTLTEIINNKKQRDQQALQMHNRIQFLQNEETKKLLKINQQR